MGIWKCSKIRFLWSSTCNSLRVSSSSCSTAINVGRHKVYLLTIFISDYRPLSCPCVCPKNNPILHIKAWFSQMVTSMDMGILNNPCSNTMQGLSSIRTGVYTKNWYKVVKTKLLSIRFVQSQFDANQGWIRICQRIICRVYFFH